MFTDSSKHFFVKNLLLWNTHDNSRVMPWKGEKDPYKIWLSEIILQQTRVEQGLAYYNRFIQSFPTVSDLATAKEQKVFKLWEGLGYYTRCKNLIATAKIITQQYQNQFPTDYQSILLLKGIGPYTAAAIASFAYNLPYAVVDGNVYRVLARFFGIHNAVDTTEGKKIFNALAQHLLDKKNPGIYNQAIMDFGAVVCKPKLPQCEICTLRNQCKALKQSTVEVLPLKSKSIEKKTRWLHFLVVQYKDSVFIRKRKAGDIWENLYEFVPFQQVQIIVSASAALKKKIAQTLGTTQFTLTSISPLQKQVLTHQIIFGQFLHIQLNEKIKLAEFEAVSLNKISKFAFPRFIDRYLPINVLK
ncbi:MAG: A/G-specific adenine glycosylase [Ferruginibacter sp.]